MLTIVPVGGVTVGVTDGVIVGVVDVTIKFVVPLIYPDLLAVAVIVPKAALIKIVTCPLVLVVPLPVPAPVT